MLIPKENKRKITEYTITLWFVFAYENICHCINIYIVEVKKNLYFVEAIIRVQIKLRMLENYEENPGTGKPKSRNHRQSPSLIKRTCTLGYQYSSFTYLE